MRKIPEIERKSLDKNTEEHGLGGLADSEYHSRVSTRRGVAVYQVRNRMRSDCKKSSLSY